MIDGNMNAFVIIISVLLFLLAITMIVYSMWGDKKNSHVVQGGNIFSFTSPYFKPDPTSSSQTGAEAYLNGTPGSVQLTCPSSTVINVISASFSVGDTYGQCFDQSLCANALPTKQCPLPAKSLVDFCNSNSSSPFCANASSSLNWANPMCSAVSGMSSTEMRPPVAYSGIGEAACIPTRDATAFVSASANGKQSATIDLTNTLQTGPLPCLFADVVFDGTTPSQLLENYAKLPNAPQVLSSSGATQYGTANQGYVLHGIYACIPQGSGSLF